MTQKSKFVFRRVENIVGKEENAGHQHLLFPVCLLEPSPLGSFKVWISHFSEWLTFVIIPHHMTKFFTAEDT